MAHKLYTNRKEVVPAFQYDGDAEKLKGTGFRDIKEGDWVFQKPDGGYSMLSDEEFKEKYEPYETKHGEVISMGAFALHDEGTYLKIQHRSKDFSMRLYSGPLTGEWFNNFKDNKESIDLIASGIKFFSITALQNPGYFRDFCKWNKEYFDKLAEQKVVSEEEDQEIIKEQKAMYDGEHRESEEIQETEGESN